jgi:CheY-like chemotaxis protein
LPPLGARADAPHRDVGCDPAVMRILLVDPEPDSRSAIVHWLDEFFGHVQIESTASGAEALRAMEKSAPDLVLAAHPMPAPGGAELAAIVKARPNPPAVVIIASGCAAGLDLQCRAAGADLWLEQRHLQARLLDFLQRRFPAIWARSVSARALSALCARSGV